jgi:hypothetical protein
MSANFEKWNSRTTHNQPRKKCLGTTQAYPESQINNQHNEESGDASLDSLYDLESNLVSKSRHDKLFAADQDWFDKQAQMAPRKEFLETCDSNKSGADPQI